MANKKERITMEKVHELIKDMPLGKTKVIISKASNMYSQWYAAFVFNTASRIQKKLFSKALDPLALMRYFKVSNEDQIDVPKFNRTISKEWGTVLPVNLLPRKKITRYPYYRFSRYLKRQAALDYWFNYFKTLSIPCVIEKVDKKLPYALWIWEEEAAEKGMENTEKLEGEIVRRSSMS